MKNQSIQSREGYTLPKGWFLKAGFNVNECTDSAETVGGSWMLRR